MMIFFFYLCIGGAVLSFQQESAVFNFIVSFIDDGKSIIKLPFSSCFGLHLPEREPCGDFTDKC